MSASKNSKKSTNKTTTDQIIREFESDVLFQKIYGKWYAFSVVEGECMMTHVPDEQIESFSNKVKK